MHHKRYFWGGVGVISGGAAIRWPLGLADLAQAFDSPFCCIRLSICERINFTFSPEMPS